MKGVFLKKSSVKTFHDVRRLLMIVRVCTNGFFIHHGLSWVEWIFFRYLLTATCSTNNGLSSFVLILTQNVHFPSRQRFLSLLPSLFVPGAVFVICHSMIFVFFYYSVSVNHNFFDSHRLRLISECRRRGCWFDVPTLGLILKFNG